MRTALGLLLVLLGCPAALIALAYLDRWRLRRARRGCAPEPTHLGIAIAALAAEYASFLRLLLRPSCARSARSATGDRIAIIVPGWLLPASAYRLLRRRLAAAGWPTRMCAFRRLRLDLEAANAALERELDELSEEVQFVALVAYGTGGAVARHYLRRRPAKGVRRLITLGTAHGGGTTALFSLGPLRALRAGGPLERKLNAADHLPQQFDVVAIHSSFDAVVLAEEADYPGAFNIDVLGVGHLSLLTSHRVFDLLLENLNAP